MRRKGLPNFTTFGVDGPLYPHYLVAVGRSNPNSRGCPGFPSAVVNGSGRRRVSIPATPSCHPGPSGPGQRHPDASSTPNHAKRTHAVTTESSATIEKESEFLLTSPPTANAMSVTKRNGTTELVDLNKIDLDVAARLARRIGTLPVPLQPARGVHHRAVLLGERGGRQAEYFGLDGARVNVVQRTVVLPEGDGLGFQRVHADHELQLGERTDRSPAARPGTCFRPGHRHCARRGA